MDRHSCSFSVIYGAVLSTITFINQKRDNQPQCEIKAYMIEELNGYKVRVDIINTGKRNLVIDSYGIMLPAREKVFLHNSNEEIKYQVLEHGNYTSKAEDVKEVFRCVQCTAYNRDDLSFLGFVVDATGKEYTGKFLCNVKNYKMYMKKNIPNKELIEG